jgi:hypothetical protein
LDGRMNLMKNAAVLLLAGLLCGGCATVTNLTASKQPRNKTGLYLMEAAFNSDQQALIITSIKPKVVVGPEDSIPMEPVPLVRDRWQAYVPIGKDQPDLRYHFQFDYMYNAIPEPRANSVSSPEYKLTIMDR